MLMADREAQELFATMLENKIQPDGRTYALMLLGDLFDSTCFLKKGQTQPGCLFAMCVRRRLAKVESYRDTQA